MPSWIRNLVKSDGSSLVECDYKCLHPTIASSLLGGSSKFLTHQRIADSFWLDVKVVKTEHLSFFNKKIWDAESPYKSMKSSPLWSYYEQKEPSMLKHNVAHKRKHGHASVAQILFSKEVAIMSDSIEQLNAKGIYPLYIYDALMFAPRKNHLWKRSWTMPSLPMGSIQ